MSDFEMASNWRKSSRSNPNGACLEAGTGWRKSSHSSGDGNCLEAGTGWRSSSHCVARECAEVSTGPVRVLVRDTKQAHLPGSARTVLAFSPQAWAAFTARVKAS